MSQRLGLRAHHALVAGLLVAVCCGSSRADDKQARTQGSKGAERGRAAGVIVKVEPIDGKQRGGKGSWKLTINPDVVWRDFVRDQAVDPEKAARTGTAKAAAKGREAVATEGHPRDEELLLVVELDAKTEITTRYRTSTDAFSDGSPTPEGAAAVEAAADASSPRASGERPKAKRRGERREVLKAHKLEPKELKPGLWVEVRFREKEGDNRAGHVMVMRPVGGPDTSPDKEKPAAKSDR